jgi:hypothetical protein
MKLLLIVMADGAGGGGDAIYRTDIAYLARIINETEDETRRMLGQLEAEGAIIGEGLRVRGVSAQYDLVCAQPDRTIDFDPLAPRYQKAVIPQSIRAVVFERDGYQCKHCGATEHLRVDHIYPERHGGTLDLANLQTLCRSCNSRKGARVAQ